jgi:hypothetical protein
MSYKNPIAERLKLIDNAINDENGWAILVEFARDMKVIFDASGYADRVTIKTWPLDMIGRGSISFAIDFMPADVYLKLWNQDGYYLAFFKLTDGYFDRPIINTFNETGVIPVSDLDEAEEKILDYLTMELYKWINHKTI